MFSNKKQNGVHWRRSEKIVTQISNTKIEQSAELITLSARR
jgi:hypothetical protein